MRMFLVGMCDIFLLLYLTALAEIDSRPVSSLTVDDYNKVQVTARQAGERADRLEAEGREREKALNDQIARLEVAVTRERKVREDVQRERAAAVEAAHKASSSIELLERDRDQRAADLAAAQVALRTEMQKAADNAKLADEARSSATAERLRVEEERRRAQAEADKQRELADAANRARTEAERDRERALQVAAQAREREASAVSYAERAVDSALTAHEGAERAMHRAAEADRVGAEARTRLAAVNKPASAAFTDKVESKLVTLSIDVTTRGTFGPATDRLTLRGVPVQYGERRVLFVPLSHLGIRDSDDSEDLTLIKVAGPSAGIVAGLVSPTVPRVLGFILPGPASAVRPIAGPQLSDLMPTLLAVRNGGPREFGDRVRELSDQHLPFSRDRLVAEGGDVFSYKAEGFRGTGDFGEQLVTGDQVVDLDGTFIGIVVEPNRLLLVPDLAGWEEIGLADGSALNRFFTS